MKRRSGLEPLGLVLSRDAALRLPESMDTSPVSARDWEAAVGSRIAARARPVRLDRGVLTVRTATAPWAQELAFLADAILAQLRGRGVVVESLRFRVGPVDAPERPPSRSEVRTAPREVLLPAAIAASVQRVADPDLRAAIAHAAARNLGWQAALSPPSKPRRR
jgi:predicted nucleic acid-binding Zn ribbon protein